MTVTLTRTSNNLTIHAVARRPDGKVVIRFSLLNAGIYYNVRPYTKAYNRRFPGGFVMTPAIGDPQHTPDPIFVPYPNAVFTYIWDAPADGYATGSLYGWTFQLSYVDFLCCDELDEEPDGGIYRGPGGGVPPGQRPPPPPGDDVPGPVPAPGEGIPSTDLPNPGESHPVIPAGAAGQTPNAGLTTPLQSPYLTVGGQLPLVDGRPRQDLSDQPTVPQWLYDPRLIVGQTPDGQPIYGTPPLTPEQFAYQRTLDTSPPSEPIAVGTPPPVLPGVLLPPPLAPQQTAQTYGLDEYYPLPPYRRAPEFLGLFALPSTSGGLSVRGLVPHPSVPTARSNLYYVVENSNQAPMSEIYSMVLGLDGLGNVYVIQDPTAIQATSAQQTHNPPGTVPPGTSAGNVVCLDWPQFATPQMSFLVVLLNQVQQPLAAATIPGFFMRPGTVPPQGMQIVDLLGPGVRSIARFPSGIEPTYEGSVNAVGYEDTYVFTVLDELAAIVVRITADAQQLGFEPVMEIYDVDDMSTPLVTHSSRFRMGAVDVDPSTHSIGWQNAGELTVGNKYAIVIRHVAKYYSRRWAFQIFHVQTPVETGGTLTIDEDGNLAGELSCSYGRQSVKILNTRTDESIFIRTNERGVSYDIQRDTTEGTSGRTLAVSYGDVLEIIRPGPGVLYRRHGDLIGRVQL